MKNSLSSLSALIASCIICAYTAQPSNAQIGLGLKGMVGVSTLRNTEPNNSAAYTYEPGISKGFSGFANLPIAKHFSLHAEAGYVFQGGSTKNIHQLWQADQGQTTYTDCVSDTRLHYLSAGVMLRYRYMLGDGWSVYLQGGPAQQLLVSAEQADIGYGNVYESAEGSASLLYTSFDEIRNVTGQFHSWNSVVNGGLGVIWEEDGDCAMLEIGASHGLHAIEKNGPGGGHTTVLYSVTLGYGTLLNWNSRKGGR